MAATDILERLYALVLERRKGDPETSYIARRLKQGTAKIAQKVGEEAVETVIAAMQKDKKELVLESADMIFHWLMLLADGGVTLEDVMKELERREGISGLDEKASRKLRRRKDDI
jgi:phosphoribosyl-ATP pyrophosphohydrolase